MWAATPGTVLALAGAIILALVTFSTPIIKSLAFLTATIANKDASFGTLGYCIEGVCSKPALGYTFDPNQLLGDSIIPERVSSAIIKGLTYTLILHPVALAFAALTFVAGIFAHCGGFAVSCFTTCFASTAASFALVAFGLDLGLFVLAKKRIEAVDGATAAFGTALWMTLASFIVMMMASCAFGCACGGSGGGRRKQRNKDDYGSSGGAGYGARPGKDSYAEQVRMEALQAEQDRQRRQEAYNRGRKHGAGDLPKFAEYVTEHEVVEPLTSDYDDPHGTYAHPAQHAGIGAGGAAYAYSDPVYSNAQPAYGAAPMRKPSDVSYVQGVGQGYGRRDEYNAAGHGAHAGSSSEVLYSPGAGPQPFRDGTDMAYSLADQGASVAQHTGAYRSPSADHSQYNNAHGYDARNAPPMPSAAPHLASAYPGGPSPTALHHDIFASPISPSRSARGGSDSVPALDAIERRHPTTGDDGFGLAVLQAGAAAAAAGRVESEGGHPQAAQLSSSGRAPLPKIPQGHTNDEAYEVHAAYDTEGLSGAQGDQHGYGGAWYATSPTGGAEETATAYSHGPPGYEDPSTRYAAGASPQGHQYNGDSYPQEKR